MDFKSFFQALGQQLKAQAAAIAAELKERTGDTVAEFIEKVKSEPNFGDGNSILKWRDAAEDRYNALSAELAQNKANDSETAFALAALAEQHEEIIASLQAAGLWNPKTPPVEVE